MIEKQLVTEIAVTVKDENCKITESDTHYGILEISEDSHIINRLVAIAVTKLGTHPDREAPEIIVKTKTVWQ
jgi:hypothetical protein